MDNNPPSFAARIASLATTNGSQPALTIGDQVISYADLDLRSNQFARHLSDLGASTGDFVTIAAPNSPEFVLAVIGCWKIGAIPQPVSSRLPGRELDAIVELADEDTDEEAKYRIVGTDEADIKQGLLSVTAPLARALIGKAVGDSIEVETPGGTKAYEILKVTYK